MSKQSMKIYEALRWASSFLAEHDLEQPIAEILLKHYLQVDRTKMFQMLQDELPTDVELAFKSAIEKVVTGIPVQHITGVEDFFGRQFKVNQHVLIPRPETEELVLGVLQRLKGKQGPISVVDVGTGSGAISISLALEDPTLQITTIDISADAIEVAKLNARNLGANIEFLQGDLLQPFIDAGRKVDVVVSNPPYISEEDFQELAVNVRDFEPTLALVGGVTGYELYEKLAEQIPKVLNSKGMIAFEVGAGQSKYVEALIKAQYPDAHTEIVFDINGKDRMVFGTLR